MCLISSTVFCQNIYNAKKKWARSDQKRLSVFMSSTRYSWLILMKLKFSRHLLKNIKMSNFMEIRPMGAEQFHAGRQTDGNDQPNSPFSPFRDLANLFEIHFQEISDAPRQILSLCLSPVVSYSFPTLSLKLLLLRLSSGIGSGDQTDNKGQKLLVLPKCHIRQPLTYWPCEVFHRLAGVICIHAVS